MKRFGMFILLAAAMCAESVFAQTEIRDAEGLAAIGKDPASLYGDYVLTADIAVEDWDPIGSQNDPFEGKFNGKGYTITILSLLPSQGKVQTLTAEQTGLFAAIGKKGVVQNLKMAGEWSYESGTNSVHIGALAGQNEGRIQNCVADGEIRVKGGKTNVGLSFYSNLMGATKNSLLLYTNGAFAGGLVGVNVGTIENCRSSVAIFVDGDGAKCGGGIAGGNGSDAGGTIAQCITTGAITTTGSGGAGTKGYFRGAGGIAGQNCRGGHIINSVALNDKLTATHVQGVVGINTAFESGTNPMTGKVTDSFYLKTVSIFRKTDANRDEKAVKKAAAGSGMKGKPVDLAETQAQTWWKTPKDKKSKFTFAFGADEASPWVWDETRQGPALFWEIKSPLADPDSLLEN